MSDSSDMVTEEDIKDLFSKEIQVDSDLPSPDILPKKIGSEDARTIDQCLDVLDAISIAFLIIAKPDHALLFSKILEQSGRNEVSQALGAPSGLVYLFWYSAVKNNDKLWEAKLCEALYLTNNLRILHDYGLSPEEAKLKFEKSYLDPWLVKLYLLCRDFTEEERQRLTMAADLTDRFQLLETQLLFHITETNVTTEECYRQMYSHLTRLALPYINIKPERRTSTLNEYERGPGFVLIINQKIFNRAENNPAAKSLDPRLGTDLDRDRLKIAFTYLGAKEIRIYNNLITEEVEAVLDTSASYLNENSDLFKWCCVCVLSHGARSVCNKDEVYASDGIPMDRKRFIMQFADTASVPNFRGKPKIFIFQACRTAEQPSSPAAPSLVTEQQTRGFEIARTNPETGFPLINHGDYVVCSSTIEDFVTYRSTTYGSFYIRYLCEELIRLGHQEDITTILTSVNGKMSSVRYSSMSNFETVLTKKFYFNRTRESFAAAAELLVHDVNFRELYINFLVEETSFKYNDLDV